MVPEVKERKERELRFTDRDKLPLLPLMAQASVMT